MKGRKLNYGIIIRYVMSECTRGIYGQLLPASFRSPYASGQINLDLHLSVLRLVISCQKTYILKCSNCALYIQFSAPVYRESVKEVWVIPPVITNTVEISEKKRYSSEKGLSGSVNKNTKRGG
jgi:hypothetical protein